MMPGVSQKLVHVFFTLLADAILERELRDSDGEEGDGEQPGALHPQLAELMQRDGVIRKITLAYILGRLGMGDTQSAQPFLAVAADALKVRNLPPAYHPSATASP